MTHRPTRKGKSIFSRTLAWLAAYAFVLQTVLAPIAAAAATRDVLTESTQVVLCAEHTGAVDQNPTSTHDHEIFCKFCLGCPAHALIAPETLAGTGLDFAVTTFRWRAISSFGPDRDFRSSHQARGPPTLT